MRAILLLLLLAGCAEPPAPPATTCPEPVVYSEKEQRDAAAELRALREAGQAPVLRGWIVDYGRLRAQLRGC